MMWWRWSIKLWAAVWRPMGGTVEGWTIEVRMTFRLLTIVKVWAAMLFMLRRKFFKVVEFFAMLLSVGGAIVLHLRSLAVTNRAIHLYGASLLWFQLGRRVLAMLWLIMMRSTVPSCWGTVKVRPRVVSEWRWWWPRRTVTMGRWRESADWERAVGTFWEMRVSLVALVWAMWSTSVVSMLMLALTTHHVLPLARWMREVVVRTMEIHLILTSELSNSVMNSSASLLNGRLDEASEAVALLNVFFVLLR